MVFEKSEFALALECENEDPMQALGLYARLEREDTYSYASLMPIAIVGPVLSILIADYFAPQLGTYRNLASVVIMFAGYLPAVVLFQRKEIERGFKSGGPGWWLVSIGIFFLHLLVGNAGILVLALIISALVSGLITVPFKLIPVLTGYDEPAWIDWFAWGTIFICTLAFLFSGMYKPLPRLRHLPANVVAGVKRNIKDIRSFFIGIAISASIIGSGAHGLLYEYEFLSIGFALLTGTMFGLGLRSHVGCDPILENLNRLGQARCFLRRQQHANAYCRLREVSESPGFALPMVINELAEALTALAGQWLEKHQDPKYLAGHHLIRAEARATTEISYAEAIKANLHESWALSGMEPFSDMSPTGLVSIMRDPQVPAARRVLAAEAISNLCPFGEDPRFLDDAQAGLPNEPLLGFVEIPAGPFLMGEGCEMHEVTLPTFYIARYPVTILQTSAYELDTGKHLSHVCSSGGLHRPHSMLPWEEATDYCEWLKEKLVQVAAERLRRRSGRTEDRLFWEALRDQQLTATIPSEAEWEKAARGTNGRRFPWGDEPDPDCVNSHETGIDNKCDVGCFITGASPYGVEDLLCSVLQWTRSQYEYYPYDPHDGREHLKEYGTEGVCRGNEYWPRLKSLSCTRRIKIPRSDSIGEGLRIALSSFRSV